MNLYLNCIDNLKTYNKKNYLLRAARRLNLRVFDLTAGIKPDYVLNIEPYNFVKGNIWTGIWEIDLLCDRENTGPDWKDADTIYVAGSKIPSRLEEYRNRLKLLFQACDIEFIRPDIQREYDFVFCGSMTEPRYTERIRLNKMLQRLFTYQEFNPERSPQDYIASISTAKVQFIRSMKHDQIADGELAQRFFECLYIGPVLTNYVDDLQHTGLVEGQDYLSYKDDEELMAKMNYLIDNPQRREEIAKSGREKALMYHTYEHRLLTILNDINYFTNQS